MVKHALQASALAIAAGLGLVAAGCGATNPDPLAAAGITPVYNSQSGRLEQLLSDRDGDGRAETRAYMDGPVIKYIEIDRNGDGSPDRWEYYAAPASAPAAQTVSRTNTIDHAEEVNGPGPAITRREFYADGLVKRVVDDVDADGRPDKWEYYDRGVLARVELDLVGKGYASQRLVYGPDGVVIAVETDPNGDGTFVPASARSAGELR
jgi:hypothetical protein